MRDVAILTFVTLDGVMQGPSSPDEDRSGGFDAGGWAANYWDEVMDQVGREAMAAPYDMLFGRRTYELFAGHWPNAPTTDPAAQRMNAAKKYVATTTLETLSWSNSHKLEKDVPAAVKDLKRNDGPLLQVHGSGDLIRTLLAHDLIDEFRLWTFPVVVGRGKRLFDGSARLPNLALAKTAATPGGVVMTIYRRT